MKTFAPPVDISARVFRGQMFALAMGSLHLKNFSALDSRGPQRDPQAVAQLAHRIVSAGALFSVFARTPTSRPQFVTTAAWIRQLEAIAEARNSHSPVLSPTAVEPS